MTLKELGESYLDNVKTLEECIAKKQEELKVARSQRAHIKSDKISGQLLVLKDMLKECKKNGNYLVNYYKKREVSECQNH